MPYITEELFQKAKEQIKKKKLLYIEDIVAYLPCDKTTFYSHFKVDSHQLNELKELLHENRTELKVSLRFKWEKSESPALQMALYKLAATPEEHRALSMTHTDITTKGESINVINIGNSNVEL